MRHRLYSVYDVKAGAYLPPFMLQNDAVAIRAFGEAVRDVRSAFAKHPADYTLFCVASFDDAHGVVTPIDRECIVTALELVAEHRPGIEEDQPSLPLRSAK